MGLGKMALIGVAAVAAISVGASVLSIATAPLRSASGVVNRTLDADNVIRTYELFHDRYNGFESRKRQIAETQAILNGETDQREKQRLRIDLGAQRQSCRDIAAAYNSDATKTNRSIFKGREAPEQLNMADCG
jgi:hypothetical protein